MLMQESVDDTDANHESARHALAVASRHPECGSHQGLRWYCGQAKAGRVREARDHLVRQHFEVLVPLCARPGLNGNVTVQPLLGSYFLVRFDLSRPGWKRIVSSRGVVRLFPASDAPVPLRDAEVEALRHVRLDEFGEPQPDGARVKIGRPVRAVNGPHRGSIGICVDIVSMTARCLLFTPRGPLDVELPVAWLAGA